MYDFIVLCFLYLSQSLYVEFSQPSGIVIGVDVCCHRKGNFP